MRLHSKSRKQLLNEEKKKTQKFWQTEQVFFSGNFKFSKYPILEKKKKKVIQESV